MSIINLSIPTDSKILEDIQNQNVEIKFIGAARISQNIRETVFTRFLQFKHEEVVKKVVYKKNGVSWGFESLEVVNL